MKDYDVCIIGSGAGAGPVAYTLAMEGYKVLVLEKGKWYTREDFNKDEIAVCRRSTFTPLLKDEPQVIEDKSNGEWVAKSNSETGWDFWNGNMVGGSSNLMSGYFHRLKPVDFRLKSEFGPVHGANVADWPVTYDDFEPYYTKAEEIVGISGQVVKHPNLEPRSTNDFPYPKLNEHPTSKIFDKVCEKLGYHSIPTARAIISRPEGNRLGCSYSAYCGSYGCATDAKGSSRAALLDKAIATGNCEIRSQAKVFHLETNPKGNVSFVRYYDEQGKERLVDAKIFVVACQAVESSRLLLLSKGPKHPNGIGNKYGQVGKNFIFSAGGTGGCDFHRDSFDDDLFESMKLRGLFVNRALQDWYVIDDPKTGRIKGGTIDFLLAHSNPIKRANGLKYDEDRNLLWGLSLKQKLKYQFDHVLPFRFEVFCDWHPTDNCFVSLDPEVKDKWGTPVAKLRVGYHKNDLIAGNYLAEKSKKVLELMKGKDIYTSISGAPPVNLMAGGCRFGNDPGTSVLNADCRAHDTENLYVTDGSFMPTGGSVPFTFTIYANAFRVADIILKNM
jgi:choline dehydrogenase-like flavoprotein